MIIFPNILFVAQKDDFVTLNVKFFLIFFRKWLMFGTFFVVHWRDGACMKTRGILLLASVPLSL